MSWLQIAQLGVSAISAISASNKEDRAKQAADARAAESQAFEQQRYDEWQETYGRIEDNLGDYYNSLTPERYTAMGLEAIEIEKQGVLTSMNEQFAQRGIVDSGISLAGNLQLDLTAASERAKVRLEAPEMAAKQKQSFLSLGINSNAADRLGNSLAGAEQTAQSRYNLAQDESASAQSNFADVALGSLGDYVDSRSSTKDKYAPPTNASIGGN